MDAQAQGRRLAAARALSGFSSHKALAAKLDVEGLGGKTIGAIERGERTLSPPETAWIAEKLDLPRWWFAQEDLHALGPAGANDVAQRLDKLEEMVQEIKKSVLDIADAVTDVGPRSEAGEPPQAGRGSSA